MSGNEKWKWKSFSCVWLFVTPWTARLLCPWDSPGKNIEESYHFLLQVIFLTQGSNPGLLHCRWIPYPLNHQGFKIRLKYCQEMNWAKSLISLTFSLRTGSTVETCAIDKRGFFREQFASGQPQSQRALIIWLTQFRWNSVDVKNPIGSLLFETRQWYAEPHTPVYRINALPARQSLYVFCLQSCLSNRKCIIRWNTSKSDFTGSLIIKAPVAMLQTSQI